MYAHTPTYLWMHVCLHIMAPSAARVGSFATSSVTTFIHLYFSFEGKNQQSLHGSRLTLSRHMDTGIDSEGFVQTGRSLYRLGTFSQHQCRWRYTRESSFVTFAVLFCGWAKRQPRLMDRSLGWVCLSPARNPGRVPSPPAHPQSGSIPANSLPALQRRGSLSLLTWHLIQRMPQPSGGL